MEKQRQKVRFHVSFSNPVFFFSFFDRNVLYIDYVMCPFLGYDIYDTVNVCRMGQARRKRAVDETAHWGCVVPEGNPSTCVGGDSAWPAERVSESFDNNLVVIQVRSCHWKGHLI